MIASLGWLIRVAAATARTLAFRAVGRRRVAGWSLRTELIQATSRATLDSSLRYGVEWFRGLQERTAPKALLAQARRLRAENVGGVDGLWFEPTVQAPERTILYLHGGGYVFSSSRVYDDLCSRLAVGASARVFCPDYRRAPEVPLPGAFEDCVAVYEALVAENQSSLGGGDTQSAPLLVGDSAGGNLVIATACAARDRDWPLPSRCVLFSPWVDPFRRGGSVTENSATDIGPPEWLDFCAERAIPPDWRADGSLLDSRVAPLTADLSGLPMCLIQVGGREMLLDQVRDLAERLRSHGVTVDLEEEPDMFHVWQLMANTLRQGEVAVESACRFLRQT